MSDYDQKCPITFSTMYNQVLLTFSKYDVYNLWHLVCNIMRKT